MNRRDLLKTLGLGALAFMDRREVLAADACAKAAQSSAQLNCTLT